MVKTDCTFMGMSFLQASSNDEIANFILSEQGKLNTSPPIVFTPNSFILSELDNYPNLSKLKESSYILPDGQPLIWLSKNLKKRHTGADLFTVLWENYREIANESLVVAPNESSLRQFKLTHPKIRGVVADQFRDEEHIKLFAKRLAEQLVGQPAKYVFVHLGFPKQEILCLSILENLEEMEYSRLPLFLCLGASLEFYTGAQQRAPMWIHKIGMEWFYRWLGQPVKLFRRYFLQSPKFVFKVLQYSLSK